MIEQNRELNRIANYTLRRTREKQRLVPGSDKKAWYCSIGHVDEEGVMKQMRRQWGFVMDGMEAGDEGGNEALKVSDFCPGLTSEG